MGLPISSTILKDVVKENIKMWVKWFWTFEKKNQMVSYELCANLIIWYGLSFKFVE